MFEIDHEVQRDLDPRRRAEIREFIITSLEKNKHFYFSPLIFSSRGGIREVAGGFELEPGNMIYILDGQHRISALSSAISTLKTTKEKAGEISDYEEANKQQNYIDYLSTYPIGIYEAPNNYQLSNQSATSNVNGQGVNIERKKQNASANDSTLYIG